MPGAEPSPPLPHEELRKSQRVGLVTQVECKATGDYALGRSQDVSEGGLLVITGKTFDCGIEVVVRFNLPPYPPGILIESRGVVVWVRAGGSMGIQLMQLKDQQLEAITKYIQLEGRITQRGPL